MLEQRRAAGMDAHDRVLLGAHDDHIPTLVVAAEMALLGRNGLPLLRCQDHRLTPIYRLYLLGVVWINVVVCLDHLQVGHCVVGWCVYLLSTTDGSRESADQFFHRFP
jgi:hypothetical protein